MLYVTASSETEAQRIARSVVEKKLAACANIIPGMQSIYRWKGEIEEAEEWLVLLKTTGQLETDCTREIVNLHTYECPCVVSFNLTGGNEGYLEWMKAQL